MVRQIIEPKTVEYIINIPNEYLNKKVEILVLPFFDDSVPTLNSAKAKNSILKTSGILRDRMVDPVKWQQELRSEWKR